MQKINATKSSSCRPKPSAGRFHAPCCSKMEHLNYCAISGIALVDFRSEWIQLDLRLLPKGVMHLKQWKLLLNVFVGCIFTARTGYVRIRVRTMCKTVLRACQKVRRETLWM